MSSMEPGGPADKFGNEYERLWVVYQMLRVLEGHATAVTWEPPGQDGYGIDVLVELSDGTFSHQSCKREAGHGKWTLAQLQGRGVLDAAKLHLSRGTARRFAFVSRDPCHELRDLTERIGRYDGRPKAYYDALPAKLKGSFHQLGVYWGLAPESSTDDRALIFQMLTLCEAKAHDLKLLQECVRALSQFIVDADPDTTRTRLADFAIEHLGTRLDRSTLEGFLKAKSLPLRGDLDTESTAAAISSLQARFTNSIKPYLIRGQLIHREAATQLVDVATSDEAGRHRLIMVHGRAGIGKSAALSELVETLQERRIPFLPIRLDRNMPVGSADSFGREGCHLQSSPARALESIAGHKRSVLILDQLDALRWTAAHTDQSMDVLTEVVREALNPLSGADITVVVVCRTFDLEDDPRIAHLKSLAESLSIEIGLLTPKAAREIVDSGHNIWASLSEAQRRLLQQPQALYLWTQLKAVSGDAPIFRTHADLMRAFLDDLFQRRRPKNIDTDDLQKVLDQLVERMDITGRLTAPSSLINSSQAHVVDFLQSSDIIRVDDHKQCIFTHQSYFDFLVADELNRRILNGDTNLLDWLRVSGQSLFRRDQLRQLLALQRDDDPTAYLGGIEALLTDDRIRFHLKHLAIRLLGQAEPPILGEVELVIRLLERDDWREHIVGQVLWNKPSWFHALDEQGIWTKWLDSRDESRINMALRMLGMMSSQFGDRVAPILSGCIANGEPWPERVAQALTWGDVEEETDAVFELRLALIRQGQQPFRHVWWQRLAQTHPKRCIWLFDLRLRLLVDAGHALRANQGNELASIGIEPCKEYDEQWMLKAAVGCPALVWRRLASTCVPLERIHRWAVREHGWAAYSGPLHQFRDSTQLCEKVLAAAGLSLARRRPNAFKALVARWEGSPRTTLVERSLMRAMKALPDSEADYVVTWLIDKPRRFRAGKTSDHATSENPARRLIARFSKHCSKPILLRLENAILRYRDPDLKRMSEYDQKNYAPNRAHWPNHHGKVQYALLSGLPAEGLTGRALGQLGVWERKFGKPPSGRGLRSMSGVVGSTIPPDRLEFISDAQWLRLVSGDWSERGRDRFPRKVMGDDQLGEASHEHFADDMGAMARRQPSRFAKLALRLPHNAPAYYVRQILRAFDQKDPPDVLATAMEQNRDKPERLRALKRELASWRAATCEEIEAVMQQVGFPKDPETAKAICWLVQKRDDIKWSAKTVSVLASIATSHSDPEAGSLSVSTSTGRNGAMRTDVFSSGINSTRGSAASAIRHLLFDDPTLFEVLKPAINSLMADQNVGVRAAAIAICLPVLNIDRDQAVSCFLAACSTQDDRVFESYYIDNFLSHALWSHHGEMIPVLKRMARSTIDECAKRGAAWVTAAWLYERWCGDLLAVCRNGSQPQRHGVAQVVGDFRWESKTADDRIELLCTCFDDDDKDVRQAAARVFCNEEPWNDDRLVALASRFIESRAFAEDPTPIIGGLEGIKGSLHKYAPIIYAIADKFAGALAGAAKDPSTRIPSDVPELFKLLLRLYQQAQDSQQRDVQIACLDRWDALLRAGVGASRDAESLLDSMDR